MAKPTTLFDELYVLAHKHPDVFKPELLRQLKIARRFVLDESMSAFLADIGWEAYSEAGMRAAKAAGLSAEDQRGTKEERDAFNAKMASAATKPIIKVMEDVRHLARLPHAVTWIEWDELALAKRARSIYNSQMDEDLVPTKSGWLLMQHPTIETAFQGLSFGVGDTMFGSEGKDALGITPFVVTWRTDDDGTLPWPSHPLLLDEHGKLSLLRGASISGVLTGLAIYHSPMIGISDHGKYVSQLREGYHLKAYEFRQQLDEQAGMLRYVLGLLATINDLPVGITKVTTSKGFIAKGNYRKFLEHSIVTLKVPADRYRALARKAVAGMQRRAHQVRGHWRDDWRKPGNKIWIKEHQRGDASRGFVIHDYHVEKGDQ